jgi:hypothetical protein
MTMKKVQDSQPQPVDQQKPQDPEDKHGPKYDNDTKGWVKGDGQYPNFDTHKAGR